ncbi:MAG: hypothetical protein AAF514_15405 [Verrucomicrobiota bacterium]
MHPVLIGLHMILTDPLGDGTTEGIVIETFGQTNDITLLPGLIDGKGSNRLLVPESAVEFRRFVVGLKPPLEAEQEESEGFPAELLEFVRFFGGLSIGPPPNEVSYIHSLQPVGVENYGADASGVPDRWAQFLVFHQDGFGGRLVVNREGEMAWFPTSSIDRPISPTGEKVGVAIRNIPLEAQEALKHALR